jgi:hypothetical protein
MSESLWIVAKNREKGRKKMGNSGKSIPLYCHFKRGGSLIPLFPDLFNKKM